MLFSQRLMVYMLPYQVLAEAVMGWPSLSCRHIIPAVVLTLLASGCTTIPKPVARADYCGFKQQRAEVALPEDHALSSLQPREVANAMLLLSGGSLHGAFGAGLLARWKELNDGLPRFRTVTGISTGALLSTDAFIDRPEAAERAYAISDETQLLKPYVRLNKSGDFGLLGYITILRNNAVADLGPLRILLHNHITMDVLRQVVSQSAGGRSLRVGVVDVDSGDAVVLDMVDMARKATENSDGRAEHFRSCYIDAIVASSSVPMAAKPVSIDNRLYMDGGARFGVFIDRFGKDGIEENESSGPPPQLYIVINGKQQAEPQCGKADPTRCKPDGKDDFDNFDGGHGGWSLLKLARRASDILTAQIYAFSTADIIARYKAVYGDGSAKNIHYFHIDADKMLAHPFDNSTCGAWHEEDKKRLRPLQFYPRYMACLIHYGREYADAHSAELKIGHPAVPAGLRDLPR